MSLTPEQIAQRLNGVASSDIPAIADLLPATWKFRRGPEDAFREKLGLAPGFEGNARTRRGERLEPYIAQWWGEDQKRAVRRNTVTAIHPRIPWAMATADYFTDDDAADLVECKLVSPWVAKSWAESPPGYCYAQVQWQMAVLGKPRAFVAAFLEGGDELVRSYPLDFDPEFFDGLLSVASRFWDRVLAARAERGMEVSP